ncbi:hypothetical protein [uncultured Roseicyclus sp.]|uniref:hypothetical protein n=1 Tax=uncultured Roseicyclus sp. TaxID=543072 RepID=UPI002633508F|nr:hypothetical protein [uncultured Roseicyclus sp.]
MVDDLVCRNAILAQAHHHVVALIFIKRQEGIAQLPKALCDAIGPARTVRGQNGNRAPRQPGDFRGLNGLPACRCAVLFVGHVISPLAPPPTSLCRLASVGQQMN